MIALFGRKDYRNNIEKGTGKKENTPNKRELQTISYLKVLFREQSALGNLQLAKNITKL